MPQSSSLVGESRAPQPPGHGSCPLGTKRTAGVEGQVSLHYHLSSTSCFYQPLHVPCA